MNKPLRPWQHCLFSVGLTSMLIALLYYAAVFPINTYINELDERLDTIYFQLNKYKAMTQRKQQVENELKYLKQAMERNSDFIRNSSRSLAAADLQKNIKSIIEADNGSVVSIQVLNSNNQEETDNIQIKVNMKGNMTAVRNIIHKLSTHKPVLLLDNVVIQGKQSRTNRRNGQNPQAQANIDVRFDAVVYLVEEAST